MQELVARVQAALTPDLLKPAWRERGRSHPLAGHCYVAAESVFHLAGGRAAGLVAHVVRVDGGTHWYLRDGQGRIHDPTAPQFPEPVPYERGRPCGFLTRRPSRRAAVVIDRVLAR